MRSDGGKTMLCLVGRPASKNVASAVECRCVAGYYECRHGASAGSTSSETANTVMEFSRATTLLALTHSSFRVFAQPQTTSLVGTYWYDDNGLIGNTGNGLDIGQLNTRQQVWRLPRSGLQWVSLYRTCLAALAVHGPYVHVRDCVASEGCSPPI